jgi:integrase/recombinase XerC
VTPIAASMGTLTGTGRTFAAWLTERRYSPRTVDCYVGYVQRAERAVGPLTAATADNLYDWWTTLPLSAASRNGGRKALLAWFRSAGDRTGGAALELPVLPAPDGRPRPMPAGVLDQLRATAARLGGVHHVTSVLLSTTGCRVGEARLARWDAFTLDGELAVWRVTGKGSARRGPKLRDVPLHPAAVAVLRRWRDDCGSPAWVFPSPVHSGRPVADQTIRRRVYEIADAAGVLEHVNPHRWRHTFATFALDATRDLAGVQDVLGHADPATTRRYSLVAFDRMRAVVEAAYGGPALRAV